MLEIPRAPSPKPLHPFIPSFTPWEPVQLATPSQACGYSFHPISKGEGLSPSGQLQFIPRMRDLIFQLQFSSRTGRTLQRNMDIMPLYQLSNVHLMDYWSHIDVEPLDVQWKLPL